MGGPGRRAARHDDRVGRAPRPDRPDRARHLRFELARHRQRTAWFELEFECSLDGGPWEGCDTPFHYLPLEELPGGEHVLRVRAVDEFENVDPTPAEHRFTTEAGPETTILTGPGAETGDHDGDVHLRRRPGRRRDVRVLARPRRTFEPCPNPYTLTRAARRARARGAREGPDGRRRPRAGRSASWASGDVTPPVVTIHTGPAAGHERHERDVHVHRRRPRRARAPVLARRRPARLLRVAGDVHRGRPGARDRALPPARTRSRSRPTSCTCSPSRCRRSGSGRSTTIRAPDTTIAPAPPAEIERRPAVDLHLRQQRARRRRFECALDPVALPPVCSACASPPDNTARVQRPRGRPAHAARARRRPEPERRRDAGGVHLDVARAGADDDHRRRAREHAGTTTTTSTSATFELDGRPDRRDVHVLASTAPSSRRARRR